MKWSRFNTIIDISKTHSIIYNAYSDRFLLVETEMTNLLDDLNNIQIAHNDFYEKLIKAKCLVDPELDEIGRIKARQKKIDQNKSTYTLILNPTLDCNFKCWYCYETHVSRSRMSDQTVSRVKSFIRRKIMKDQNLKSFTLSFFGGEPFLQFDLVISLVQYTRDLCDKRNLPLQLSFTTNGFMLNKQKIKQLAGFGVNNMQITLDGNREQHDQVRFSSRKLGSYDKILDNVILLLQNDIYIALRINFTEKNIEGVEDVLKDLEKRVEISLRKNLRVSFHRVWQDKDGENIEDKAIVLSEKFVEQGFDAGTFPLNNVKQSCYADKLNEALINYNGDVFRCTAVDFTKSARDGYVDEEGEIVWENNSFEKRKNAKFNNPPCMNCRILPICNGGCSQKALEYAGRDYCINHFDDEVKNQLILEKIKYKMRHSPQFSLK